MAIWEKNCPKCGGILDYKRSCSKCGYSEVTGISGTIYAISSATWSSPSFSSITDTFGNDEHGEKSFDELRGRFIDSEKLSKYMEWGFLCKPSPGVYMLTEKGKQALKKNRKRRIQSG